MKAIRTKEVNENVKAANSCLRKAKWQAKELAVFTGEVVRLIDKEGHSLQGFFNRVEFVLVDGTIKFRVVINPILECENCTDMRRFPAPRARTAAPRCTSPARG